MRACLFLPMALFTAAPALAQSPAALLACVQIMGDAERLACFDGEMAKTSAEARAFTEKRAAEAAVVARAKAEAAAAKKRDTFGAEAITSRSDRFAPPEGELQKVETTISEVLTNTSGLAVFMLENGQIWRQVDPSRLPRVRPGDAITVTRTTLGGYHLNFLRTKNWALVKRVR